MKKILTISSSGGHWTQLMRVSPSFQGNEVVYISTLKGYAKEVFPCKYYQVKDTFIITDEIINNDGKWHDITLLFHLHPDINITHLEKNEVVLTHPSGIKLSLELDQVDRKLKIVKGQNEPLLGWYSESFMQREPTAVISYNKTTKSSIKVITKIRVYEY